MRTALVRRGVVHSLIGGVRLGSSGWVVDGGTSDGRPWTPPEGTEAIAVAGPCEVGWRVVDGAPVEPVPDLEQVRAVAMVAIDEQVSTIIARGFEWPDGSGQWFSLSVEAQVKWARLDAKRDAFPYPLAVNTKDDGRTVMLKGPEDVAAATADADLTVFIALQAGAYAKEALRSAATAEEIRAILATIQAR